MTSFVREIFLIKTKNDGDSSCETRLKFLHENNMKRDLPHFQHIAKATIHQGHAVEKFHNNHNNNNNHNHNNSKAGRIIMAAE